MEHPESLHTLDEVMALKKIILNLLIQSHPCDMRNNYGLDLFQKTKKGTYLSRFFHNYLCYLIILGMMVGFLL